MTIFSALPALGSVFARSTDDEREYKTNLLEEQRRSTLWCGLLVVVIWIGFGALDFARLDGLIAYWPPLASLVMAGRWAVLFCLAAAMAAAWRRSPTYDREVLVAFSALGIVAAAIAAIAKLAGVVAFDTIMIAVVMAAFLPIGLTLGKSLIAGGIAAGATVVSGTLMPLAMGRAGDWELAVMAILAFVLASVGGYLRHSSLREQFTLRRQLARLAASDPLTGLANRRAFESRIADLLPRSLRDGVAATLVIIDVDHFKRFNDAYGHQAGDEVLRVVGGIIAEHARSPNDVAARIGGEEFALFLYEVSPIRALGIVNAIASRLREARIRNDACPSGTLTMSVGVAGYDGEESFDALFRRADTALYEAKEGGRNQVAVSLSDDSSTTDPSFGFAINSAQV